MASNEREIDKLRGRWTTEGGRALSARAIKWLSDEEELDRAGVPHHDGRLDLRGLELRSQDLGTLARASELSARRVSGNLLLRNVHIANVDFSYCAFEHLGVFDSVIELCRFSQAAFVDLGMWGSTLSHCEFERCDLRSAGFGGVTEVGRPCARSCSVRQV
jgi:hypothetical protein